MITLKNLDENIKILHDMGEALKENSSDEKIKEFEDLADLIEAFEKKHFPI